MDTNNQPHPDEHDDDATSMVRVDSAQLAPPSPHTFNLPDRVEIERLTKWLDGHEININEFGVRLASHDGLSRYVIAVANHSALNADSAICEPTHAAAFLGQRALRRLLSPLAVEPPADA
jgi:hypothetical protein